MTTDDAPRPAGAPRKVTVMDMKIAYNELWGKYEALVKDRDALAGEAARLRDQIERIREDAERIASWGTALHADQDGSLTCILAHCRAALARAAEERGER